MNPDSVLDRTAHWYVQHKPVSAVLVYVVLLGVFCGEAELASWLVRVALRG